jgi:hypothetical protein
VILLFCLKTLLFLIWKLGKQLYFRNSSDLTTFYCISDGTAASTGYEKSIYFILSHSSTYLADKSLFFSFFIGCQHYSALSPSPSISL